MTDLYEIRFQATEAALRTVRYCGGGGRMIPSHGRHMLPTGKSYADPNQLPQRDELTERAAPRQRLGHRKKNWSARDAATFLPLSVATRPAGARQRSRGSSSSSSSKRKPFDLVGGPIVR
jgi:hypothetical protein